MRGMIGIGDITDSIARQIEAAQSSVETLLFEPVIRLGVTGLSRAGKTVFITSLVANLLDRGRMPALRAASEGHILTAFLQPQPNDAVARFNYETNLTALTGREPHWPESTSSISQLRLSLRVQPMGLLSGVRGPKTVHLDIVDYPGEWLLDLPLLSQSYAEWAETTLAAARNPARATLGKEWLMLAESCDPGVELDEATAQTHAKAFTSYLRETRKAGLSAVAPGRFLMPGDLSGSPALTFAPLPAPSTPTGNSLCATFQNRFESYKRIVVKPFFRDHFSKIDCQIVLLDALSAINAGPRALEDLRVAMSDILTSFRPGKNSWLSSILSKRVDRILFATTKADHLHHSQHARLNEITQALLEDAKRRAEFKGAETKGMAIASIRATVEESVKHNGAMLDCVRGTLMNTGKEAAMYAGDLPEDPNHLLAPARKGDGEWLDADFSIMKFAPPKLTLKPDQGPPHIRLDQVAEFLIGDRLL